MAIVRIGAVLARLVLLVMLSWLVLSWSLPTTDPFVTDVVWLVAAAVTLGIPSSRATVVRWIRAGGLRRRVGGSLIRP